ncbi:ABC transporter permease subunit [Streptomyces sp. NBC_00094]|uniref:ABC transporter permease subunit n=1 Tax=Streptomyces sp. NBC_00094 TaxID=2903620 RepID=UPI002252BB16|nr:ABC transporter permease subunit [Streptomyces sp. NBC_00094]MCX5394931.1 ABC transporter permease subunit [Streptomyces sp. NBC_00094]
MNARLPLLWLALHRRRRMLVAVLIGMVVFETLIVVVTNTIPPGQLFSGGRKGPPAAYRAFSGSSGDVSIASYPGLLGAGLVHPFWIALQLTVIGSLAAAAVAADVESGTIELVVVRPVTRTRLLVERTAALLIASGALTAAATLTVAAGVALSPAIHADVGLGGVFAAGLMGYAFALCLIGPALAVSAAGRRRSQVLGAVIGIGAVGFAVNFIALAWEPAAPLRYASPFHYYAPGDALARGAVLWPQLTVLLGVGTVGFLLAHALLRRRDLAP